MMAAFRYLPLNTSNQKYLTYENIVDLIANFKNIFSSGIINLNLIWSPLPLTLRYQLINTEKNTAGAAGGISDATFSSESWFIDAFISGYYKIKFSDSIALENQLTVTYGFGDDDDSSWRAYFYTGPLFKILDHLALAPRLHLAVDREYSRDYFFDSGEEFKQEERRCKFPLSLWVGWSLHRQLDLSFEYTYKAFGYSNDFEGHEFTASIVHLW